MCRLFLQKYVQIILISQLFFLAFSTQADAITDAVQAIEAGNYLQARAYLSQAQNHNNPLASYNLALMSKRGQGSPADPDIANEWFDKAAKLKLVEAYNAIQVSVIKPAGNERITIIETPEEWIKAQKPNYYTLQLASSTNKKLIEKYYYQNALQGKAGYYKNRRQGEDWYALVYGAYPSATEANAAIQTLPKDLRKWSPWVRRLKDIQRLVP